MAKTPADSIFAGAAVAADCAAAAAAVYLSVFLRFDTGWFDIPFGRPANLYGAYWPLAVAAALLSYVALRALKLYKRPQRGTFHAHVPRLVRGALAVTVALLVGLAVAKNYYNVSSGVVVVFLFAFSALLLAERLLLFRLEIAAARRALPTNRVLMIGTDSTAARLARVFARDPRLRVRVSGFLRAEPDDNVDPAIPPENVLGVSAANDKLPKRLTDVPQDPGNPKTRVPLEQMKKTYYRARGWGQDGLPSRRKLHSLGIR